MNDARVVRPVPPGGITHLHSDLSPGLDAPKDYDRRGQVRKKMPDADAGDEVRALGATLTDKVTPKNVATRRRVRLARLSGERALCATCALVVLLKYSQAQAPAT